VRQIWCRQVNPGFFDIITGYKSVEGFSGGFAEKPVM
jgi:hypothetical protein